MKRHLVFSLVIMLSAFASFAQQKVKDGSVAGNNLPNKDAILELESSSKGLLYSRVALKSTTNASPLSAHVAGMMIYNTQTIADVVPGIYYNDGAKWILAGAGDGAAANIKYNPATYILSYLDASNNPVSINLKNVVKENETLTTLVNSNGTYKYTSENGTITLINVPADVINNFQTIANDNTVRQIIENIVKTSGGNVSYDGTNFTYVDNTGKSQTINIDQIVKSHETITTLVDNKNGTYTYTAEDGKTTLINVPADVINNFQTIANDNSVKQIIENIVKNTGGNVSYDGANFTYVDNTGKSQTINIDQIVKSHETITTLVDNKNGTYTYTAEDGKTTLINVPADVINNFQTIANDNSVKQIIENIVKNTGGNVSYDGANFTYVDNTGKSQTINIDQIVKSHETITTLVDNKNGTYTYTAEDGKTTLINVPADVINNFQTIANDNSVKQIIENIVKNTGGNVSYDGANFTYVDNTGKSQTINIDQIVKSHETVTTLVDNKNGTYTYTNEKNEPVNINVIGDAVTNITNKGDLYTTIKNLVSTEQTLTSLVYDATKNTLTYTDENKQLNVIDLSSLVTKNQLTSSVVDGTTTSATSTLIGNNTAYKVEVKDGAITTDKLANNAVTTDKINNQAVTADKLTAASTDAGKVATVNADGTVSYKAVSVTNATDGKNLTPGSDKVTVTGGDGTLLKAASVDVNESKLSLQNIGGLLNANQVNGGTAGDVFVVGADGKGSWVSKATATSVSNSLIGTSLTTTVNGTTGTAVDLKSAIQSAQKTTVVAAGTGTTVATATANDVTTYTVSADLANIALAGDVTGAANATKVEKIQGTAVSATAPTANQVLTYDAVSGKWTAATPTVGATNVTGAGNLTSDQITFVDGTGATLKNVKATINDKSITAPMLNSTGATNGQLATADGLGGVTYSTLTSSSISDKKGITTDGIIQVNGGTALTNSVLADAVLTIKDKSVIAGKLDAGTGTDGRVAVADAAGNVTYSTAIPSGSITGQDVKANSDKVILGGTPSGAALKAFTIDVDETKLNLTAGQIKGGTAGQVMVVGAGNTGSWVDQSTLVPTTTVSNTSDVNDLTTKVNGVTASPVKIINSNDLSLNASNKLVTTVNGVASTTALDLTPAIQGSQKTSSVINGTTTTVTSAASAGNPNNTEYKVEVKDGAITTDKLANNAVTTDKINNQAVTADKLTAAGADAGKVATVNADGTVSYKAVSVTNATDGKNLTPGSDKVTVTGGDGALLKAASVDVNESKLSLQNIGGLLNANQVNGGTAGDVFVVGADGKGSWVSKATATSVSNSLIGTSLTTTVNGTTGTAVDLKSAIQSAQKTTVVAAGTGTTVATATANDVTTYTVSADLANIALAGDVTGAANATKVEKIQGTAVSATAPTANQVLTYDAVSGKWTATTPTVGATNVTGAGNLTSDQITFVDGTGATLKNVKATINDKSITAPMLNSTGATNGQLATADGLGGVTYSTLTSSSISDKKGITTDGIIQVNGGTALTNSVLADAVLTIKDKSVIAGKLDAGAGTDGRVAVADATGNVTYSTAIPSGSITGQDVKANSDKVILGGTPAGAALKAFTIDVDETKLNLTAGQIKGGTAGQVMVVGAGNTGSWVDQSTLIPTTTNALANNGTNTLTSTVNGKPATASVVNTVANSLSGTNLTTTVNGVASTTALDLTPAIQGSQKTSSVISGTTTTVTSAASAGNPNNTEYKVEVNDAAIQAGQLKTTLSNGSNTTVASTSGGNATDYKVNVNNATATTTGAVKPGTGLSIDATTGTISVNPATITTGQGITTDGIIQVNGGTTLANSVLADAKLTIKDKSVTATKLDATGATAGQVATVNADGTVSYKAVSVTNATDGKNLTPGSDKVTVTGGDGALLKAASVDVNESKLSLQNIGGLLNANQVNGGTAGDVFVVGADGKGSWVSKATATSVSNSLIGTSLTTTVNGTTGTAVDLKSAIQSAQKTTVVAAGTGTTVATATANDVTTYTVSADLANIALAGDVTGAANATKVEKIQGTAVSATAPTANQVLTYDAVSGKWTAATPTVGATNVTGAGNLTSDQITFVDGTGATLKNVKATINDKSITAPMLNSTGATNGQVAIANGTGGVTYGNLPASSVTGFDVKANSDKVILGGTPAGAALKAFSIDVDETKLNLTAGQIKGGTAGQVMVVGAGNTGSWVDQSTLIPTTTNALANNGTNTLTSTVNGKPATASVVNTVANSLSGTNLTTTVNGVSSTTALDLTPAIQGSQKTSSVISGTTTTVTSAASAGNPNNTEYKVEVKDAAIQAGQLKTVLANGTNTTVGTPSVSGNTTTYAVNVATASGTTLGVVKQGDGTVVVGSDGALSVPASVITNAQKTTTVVAGTNTTVTPGAPNAAGNTQYTVNVATASGTTLGVVKQGDGTVVVGTDGALSVPATAITNAITADNGLNKSTASNIQLGGALTKATTIATGGSTTPANTLAISGLQPGATTDKIVVADPSTGVLKQVAAAMPKFFYMPSIIVPTAADQFVAESGITGESFGTINLYARYNKQFGTPAVSSAGAPALPVVAVNQLYFYVTWYDTSVFSNVAVSATGVLTYTVLANADVSAGSFMNIVFAVK